MTRIRILVDIWKKIFETDFGKWIFQPDVHHWERNHSRYWLLLQTTEMVPIRIHLRPEWPESTKMRYNLRQLATCVVVQTRNKPSDNCAIKMLNCWLDGDYSFFSCFPPGSDNGGKWRTMRVIKEDDEKKWRW